MQEYNVFCVMVVFNPDCKVLYDSVSSVIDNKVSLILVDNLSSNKAEWISVIKEIKSIVFIELDRNKGIAAAQNEGIRYALVSGCDFVWLSDQDTIYESDFSEKMVSSFSTQEDIAAIGPVFYDTNKKCVHPIVFLNPFFSKRMPSQGLNRVSHMIASGMVIPACKFELIGYHQENLFIDWVDMEWCWRAEKKFKQKLYVNGDVMIEHTLGDTAVKVFGTKIGFRTPFRHYFIVRNGIALALYSKSLTLGAKVELLSRSLIRVFLYPAVAPENKIEHLNSVLKGAFHGVLNRLGPK